VDAIEQPRLAPAPPARRQRRGARFRLKDPFPSVSHWIGVALSLVGLVVLLVKADGRPWHVAGFVIYGTSMVLLYLASALNHSLICSPTADARLEAFDYAAIFGLIAGTYTPLCLVNLRGPWGWGLLAAAWAIAAFGIASLFLWRGRSRLRVVTYVAMGWLPLFAAAEIIRVLPAPAVAWLILGGVVYSAGAVVYFTNRPCLWPDRFVAHDLWHCMVLAGSACHYVVMFQYVVPAG
jgi:hemolysin III